MRSHFIRNITTMQSNIIAKVYCVDSDHGYGWVRNCIKQRTGSSLMRDLDE